MMLRKKHQKTVINPDCIYTNTYVHTNPSRNRISYGNPKLHVEHISLEAGETLAVRVDIQEVLRRSSTAQHIQQRSNNGGVLASRVPSAHWHKSVHLKFIQF